MDIRPGSSRSVRLCGAALSAGVLLMAMPMGSAAAQERLGGSAESAVRGVADDAAPGRSYGVPQTRASSTGGGSFTVYCFPSHKLPDDPIVFFDQPGASHMHEFFGNRTTKASSTANGLRASGLTTCSTGYDTAAYWVPDVRVNGRALDASVMYATYQANGKRNVRAFPAGLKMIVGDAHAHHPPPESIVRWSCDGSEAIGSSHQAPTCWWFQSLTMRLNFPDCWGGRSLDSPDHKAHMAFSSGGNCPTSHPVAVPALELLFVYPTSGGPGVEIASGQLMTTHGDFFNAWNQFVLAGLVYYYLNGGY